MKAKEIFTACALIAGSVLAAIITVDTAKSNSIVKPVKLPKGRKLISVTWKSSSPEYLTRTMNSKDSAQTYTVTSSDLKTTDLTIIETK